MNEPRILARRTTVLSPWTSLVERDVAFHDGDAPAVYHSLTQAPYVAVFAVDAEGRIPLVRQYRPAVEDFTWEFPAGTIDGDETPAAAAARELREEAGLVATELHEIGSYFPDTGRLSVRSWGFFATCGSAVAQPSEAGIEVRYVTLGTLCDMVKSGEFRHQLHIALIGSAIIHGHIALYS